MRSMFAPGIRRIAPTKRVSQKVELLFRKFAEPRPGMPGLKIREPAEEMSCQGRTDLLKDLLDQLKIGVAKLVRTKPGHANPTSS